MEEFMNPKVILEMKRLMSKPKIIQRFINLLWANSPEDWILKTTYFQGTLFVSILIKIQNRDKRIRRSFKMDMINNRSNDLWGLASDCIDQIKGEIKRSG